MKTQTKPTPVQLPHDRKSSYSMLGSFTAMAALSLLLGWQPAGQAQIISDNFDDGNDTAPAPAWVHYDPIFTGSGGAAPLASWTFPTDAGGGKAFRLQCAANTGPASSLGNARAGAIRTDVNYTNFYVSVDITNWDNVNVQVMALMARLNQFSGAPGQLDGYAFAYLNGGVIDPFADNFIAIFRINNEGSRGVPGSSVESGVGTPANGNAEVHPVNLYPTNQYRLVFVGEGTHMEGRVYQLPDVTIPIARVQADSVNDTTKWTNGPVGILAFNYTDGVGTPAGGPADVTFDNFYCAPTPPQAITDDFSDSNDTLPAPAWVHVDPLADALAGAPGCYAGAGFTFPSQNYNMASPVPCIFDAGGPRVYSIAGDAIFTDFYLSVDAINWDSSAHILFGLLARAANVGLGTTDGYLLTWENGNGGPTDGDFDLLRITGEGGGSADQMEHVIPGQNSGMHLNDGTGYRFTFAGSGTNFVARIYQLPDTYNPVKTIFAQDNTPGGSLIPSGKVGLVVFDHPAQGDHAVNATFDNFFAEVAEPRLSLDTSSGSAVVSWPGNLANIWALESGTNVSTGSVWIEVPAINIGYSAGLNMHTNTAPMTETENTYYRLRRISPTQYP